MTYISPYNDGSVIAGQGTIGLEILEDLKETETIVATGVILAGIPCVDQIDIDKIKNGDTVLLDADKGEINIK